MLSLANVMCLRVEVVFCRVNGEKIIVSNKRLIVLDYNDVRKAFDREFKKTKKLIRAGENHLDNLAEGFAEADMVLWRLSIEVVCCKDCKYITEVEGGLHLCCKHNIAVAYNDYCSFGEKLGAQPRKEDI